jgi:uncharacterized membrane protein
MKTVVTAIMIALCSLVGFNSAKAQEVHARVRVGVPVPEGRVIIHAGTPYHHYYYHRYYGHPYYGYRRYYDNDARVWIPGYWNAYGDWVPGHYEWR